jgi:hypothetical protein
LFDLVDLATDVDKVGGEHVGGFVVETGCATRFGETDVRAHFVDGDLTFCGGGDGPVDMDVQHVLCDSLCGQIHFQWEGEVRDREQRHGYL